MQEVLISFFLMDVEKRNYFNFEQEISTKSVPVIEYPKRFIHARK